MILTMILILMMMTKNENGNGLGYRAKTLFQMLILPFLDVYILVHSIIVKLYKK